MMGRLGNMGIVGSVGKSPSLLSLPRIPCFPIIIKGAVEWVTMGYYRLLWAERYRQKTSELIETHRNSSDLITQTFPSLTTQFLGRRGQICSIAKEDPLGIVHVVQPEGSYFLGWDKDVPLITRNYSWWYGSFFSIVNAR